MQHVVRALASKIVVWGVLRKLQGVCGRIHARSAEVRLQVQHRKYLTEEMLCSDLSCPTTRKKTFCRPAGKGKKEVFCIGYNRDHGRLKDPIAAVHSIERFLVLFTKAIDDFAAQEVAKYPAERIWGQALPTPEYLEETREKFYARPETYRPEHDLFWALLSETNRYEFEDAQRDGVEPEEEPNDLLLLLSLAQRGQMDIPNALSMTYGGQAVGNGFRFLIIYHILPFYLWCNAIIACGWQKEPEKWGPLAGPAEEYNLRRQISEDCDFFTFIPSWRRLISPDLLFIDLDVTKDVLKRCFRLMYLTRMMCAWTPDGLDLQNGRWAPEDLRHGFEAVFGKILRDAE